MQITDGEPEWVSNPGLTFEDVRKSLWANECSGRGSDTAAARGYNAERLAAAVFDKSGRFLPTHSKPWFDAREVDHNHRFIRIESKSCVHRYPSGGYGQFRIWHAHHHTLKVSSELFPRKRHIYFFLVYDIDDHGKANEIGKLAVDVNVIDEIISDWTWTDHITKGSEQKRDISWHLLLSRVGVSVERLQTSNIVVVTDPTDE